MQIKSFPQAIVLSRFSQARMGQDEKSLFAGDVIRLLHVDTEGFMEGGISKEYFQKLS